VTGIIAASLANLPGLRHAFLTRQGGVSAGPFASLNLGQRSGDAPANVAANRERAAALLGARADRLVTARQVHSATCLAVTEPWAPDAPPEADALATDRPGLLLGVLTADCAPVLLADSEARVVGAAHAGWRGALSGIVEATVATMGQLGARPDRIHAAIGPCIARESYEVGPEFEEHFLAEDPESARHFAPADGTDRRLFDLKAYVADRLCRAGVGHTDVLPHDTCADEARFFSFRRTTKRREQRFGVQASVVGLAPRS
jgi:YfiH family protein